MSCTTSQNEILVTEKHDLYQTLMRLLLINSRCRSALTQDFGIFRFQFVKGKNLVYILSFCINVHLLCNRTTSVNVHTMYTLFFEIQMTCKKLKKIHKTYEIYKMYKGDTFSNGVFMICFASSI